MTTAHAYLPAVLNYLVNTLPVHTLPNLSASSLCLFSLQSQKNSKRFYKYIIRFISSSNLGTKKIIQNFQHPKPFTYNGLGIY